MWRSLALVTALVIGSLPLASKADTISIGQLYGFGFDGVVTLPTPLTNGGGTVPITNPLSVPIPNAPWTFTLPTAGTLTVLDLFQSFDQFEIFDNDISIGTTSVPIAGGTCDSDFICARSDPSYSLGVFNLVAGPHSITGFQTRGIEGAGGLLVSLAPVPLPGALPLFATGVAALGFLSWRRRRKQVYIA
jgi:hypothetical protein